MSTVLKETQNEKTLEEIRRHASYLSKRLFGIRFFNGKEIRKLFKKEIIPLTQKEDVNYTVYFLTGEEGLMTLVSLGINYGFKFSRMGEGAEYDILPELARHVHNRYQGYRYFLKQFKQNDNLSTDELERLDERNYATGIDEINITIYKSHLDTSYEYRVIEVRFIDYVDYESLL